MNMKTNMKLFTAAIAIAAGVGTTAANAAVIPITFDANGQASLPFLSFKNTGFNTTTGVITKLENDYTFTLTDTRDLLSSSVSGTSASLPAGTKVGSHTYATMNPEITGTLTLFQGTPGSGVAVVPGVGSVNDSPIVGSTSGSTYSYAAGVGEFTLGAGNYYLALDYSYAPNYKNTVTGKYALVAGAGGSLSGTASITPVPEASTWAMLGIGFAGVGLAGITKRRKAPRYAF